MKFRKSEKTDAVFRFIFGFFILSFQIDEYTWVFKMMNIPGFSN